MMNSIKDPAKSFVLLTERHNNCKRTKLKCTLNIKPHKESLIG